MIVRSSRIAVRIDAARREFGARFLPRLNGRYTLSELVAGEHRDDLVYALVLLGDLTRYGMLHDDAEVAEECHAQREGEAVAGANGLERADADVSGAMISVVGRGPLVQAIAWRLGTL